MNFREWLALTRRTQTNLYGVKPHELRGEERAEYVRMNVLAATDELHELLAETGWKPWKSGLGEIPDRAAAIGELVDVLHFVGNLAVVLDCTADELTAAYDTATLKNERRQREGY